MKIVLSSGHNPYQPNYDSGATGQGQQEAFDNIRMTDRVAYYLKAWGIDCVVMPHDVGDLTAEIKWVNDRYKLYEAYAIQIHRNAGGGTGNEVWTTDFEAQIPLATAIAKAMASITGLRNRGVKDIKTQNWPLGWINYVNCESVLIEARFIDVDSITDADDYLDAYAIACGIADFAKVPRGKSLEVEAAEAAEAAAKAAAEKAEADRLANLARIEAEKQAEIARIAEIERQEALTAAKKAEEERIVAEKAAIEAEKASQHTSDHQFIQRLKNLIQIIIDFFMKLKG